MKKKEPSFEEQVIHNLLPLYNQLDTHAQEIIKHQEREGKVIGCYSGCNFCCYQLTSVLLAEGIVIANAVLKKPNWMALAKDLKAGTKACHGERLTRGNYFSKQIPCAFLDTVKGKCTVYAERPSACRYLYVVSPPEDCSIENAGKNVLALNMTRLETTIWEFSAMLTKGQKICAPLPIMVLYCMWTSAKSKLRKKFMKRMCQGVPDPLEWMGSLQGNTKIFKEDVGDSRSAVLDALAETKGMFSPE